MKIKALKLFQKKKKSLKRLGAQGKYPLFPSPPSVGLCTWESPRAYERREGASNYRTLFVPSSVESRALNFG